MSDNKKVLVVDDEEHIRMLYQQELEAEGYDVCLSDGQEEILDVIDRCKPKVVVLDIKLRGGRSGLDLLQEIRDRDTEMPVILSTAYEAYQHDNKAEAADYYVVKSIDMDDLKTKLSLAMAKADKRAA
jgi:DNA-binding NtrC family response regulator